MELIPEADGSLRVKPAARNNERSAIVRVEQPLDLTLPRTLTCLYILGYDNAVLELPAASSEVMARVRETLSKLPGFEIVESSNKIVRIRCLTSAERVSSKELLERYLAIINEELVTVITANLRGEERELEPSVIVEERKLHSLLMRAMVGSWRVRTPLQAVRLIAASLMEAIADFMLVAAKKSSELSGVNGAVGSRAVAAFEDFSRGLSQAVLPLFSEDKGAENEGYLTLASVERKAAELLAESSGGFSIVLAKLLDSARLASFVARMGICASKYYSEGSFKLFK